MHKNLKKQKRTIRNRGKLKKFNYTNVRVCISKSQKNISAQIINDLENKTLVSVSSLEKDFKDKQTKKTLMSEKLAEILAQRAIEKKITKAVFDRGGYKYHGIVKIFAETLRKKGIEI